jgi:hypothetical protein
MLKICLALCVVATLATEAPVITLNLDGEGLRKTGSHYKAWKSEEMVNTKWVHHCAAKSSSASEDCALPTAKAYDHHDSNIVVNSVVCLINDAPANGAKGGMKMSCDKTVVNYALRSEYIVKYDAQDDSGNKADQVIFAIILDDETKPAFNFGGKTYTHECAKSSTTVAMPVVTDNIDSPASITKTLRINGATSTEERLYPVHSKSYGFTINDYAGVFGYKGANNKNAAKKNFVVRDTKKPTIHHPKDWSIECAKGKVGQNKLVSCSDQCDQTKDVGVCIGSARRSVRIAGKYTHFNTGSAKGCEHRHHYLYDYKGSDCVWTSNWHPLKSKHAYQNAFLKFQMQEYGNLEKDDYLKIQLKFWGSKDTHTGWIDTVKLQDDVLGWVWTTVYDAPGTGYFAHKGKVNSNWKSFNAAMERNHMYVSIRVTLHSNDDYNERHVLDNLEVFGSECRDAFLATKPHSFNVQYTCKDKSGNVADTKNTKITVKDTTRPTIHYFGNHMLEHSAGVTTGHDNYLTKHICKDSCASNKALAKDQKHSHIFFSTTGCTHAAKATHGKSYFNTLKPGTYYQKFTCNDGHGNNAISKCRTIINEDKKKPVLTILGKDIMTVEATYSANYVDDGATCSDQVDGVISQDVEVSGDVVNLGKRGTYKINYNCKDAASNTAVQLTRTVYVADRTCPTCVITGKTSLVREASFPYNDQGAVCKDNIGLGKNKIVTTNPVNVELTGKYTVTYKITDEAGNTNMGECPYTGCKKCTGAKAYYRVVVVKDTLKPTIHLSFGSKVFHKTSAVDTGLNSQANPAGKLMAETSSVNGWIIGAVASAVAGVALLALGSKKVATSVPV